MILYIIIAFLIIIIAFVAITFNSLKQLDNKVNEAFATMDVYLKKRWDLIPNLVETVKGYAKHEKSTLEEVVKLRNSAYDDMNTKEKIKANNEISGKVTKLMALAEAYPEIKADKNFLDLSKSLSKAEDEIANSRKYYNAVVRLFNNKVEMFPSNLIAGLFGYKTKTMFVAKNEERENIKVDLDK